MDVPYSAKKDDLYYPAKNAAFFPHDRPQSDAALCVEMARLAYCRLDASFAFDQAQIREVLGRIQFNDWRFFETAAARQGGGSHAFLALDENKKLAVLSFRGTDKDDPTDLMDDINFRPQRWQGGGNVHSGFDKALQQIWPDVRAGLEEFSQYEFLFTGHSLGAAMATLASALKTPKSLYTIGSPRVGDQTFADQLRALDNHRYVDCCDIVPQVPPKSFGYAHIPGDIHYINFNRAVKQLDPNDPAIGPDRTEAEMDYLENYSWRIGDVALRPLADHAPINYVLPVTAATP